MSKKFTSYEYLIDNTVDGIPCQIAVTHFSEIKGSYSYNAASDIDYYGETQLDWCVLDRKGYHAPWLESKLTDSEICRIEEEVVEWIHEDSRTYY
jgi:hypothetical protein